MNETLILNDGTQLNGHAIETDGTLWLYLNAGTMGDVFSLLNDPEKTKVIKASQYGAEKAYKGYKHLFCIREETTQISAGLRKK